MPDLVSQHMWVVKTCRSIRRTSITLTLHFSAMASKVVFGSIGKLGPMDGNGIHSED